MKRHFILWMMPVVFLSSVSFGGDKKAITSFITTKPNLDMTSLSATVVPTCGNTIFDTTRTVKLVLNLQCFPTNLRAVDNPVAPLSLINFYIRYSAAAGGREIRFTVPANATNPNYGGIPDGSGNPTDVYEQPVNLVGITAANIQRHKNIVTIDVDNVHVPAVNAAGEIDRSSVLQMIEWVEAVQQLDPANSGGTFIGVNGPLSTEIIKDASADVCTQTLNIRVPGAARPDQLPLYLNPDEPPGFCGGWYSPLMLFFDAQRPKFTGITDFALNAYDKNFFWPEKNAPGYFLVLDRNKNGKIDDGSELFGDGYAAPNGFEELKKFDLNKDNVIDKKDAVFSQLRLWRDVNSNGISEPNEMFSLNSKSVTSIQVKYIGHRMDFGKRARQMQSAQFKFKQNGQTKTGDVLDIWFSSPNMQNMVTKKPGQ